MTGSDGNFQEAPENRSCVERVRMCTDITLDLNNASPCSLSAELRLLRSVDLCFRIDQLNLLDLHITTGQLGRLLLESLPNLALLQLDLETFTEDEVESRFVPVGDGGFHLMRPTYLREEYERWWWSQEGREFEGLWRARSILTIVKSVVWWTVVNGHLPPQGDRDDNIYSGAASKDVWVETFTWAAHRSGRCLTHGCAYPPLTPDLRAEIGRQRERRGDRD
ncbi:hypothetical protein DFH07DRAFT_774463 [Mycena maculata]|uniref:Uncharacterized protein n=1 Tax=Mycena maculata TaxID=230809 RepID=A0AAD7J0J4_9AGAR|nr:hypothetical protein DFH07DRAFT_774463 [Mycena maculata]